MRSVNKVILIGNLTRDPEMRQTPNGQYVTTLGIATNREWITKGGDRKSLAEYHDIVAWARLAEICNKYLRKGKLIYVEGYLKTRSWDTPEGIRKFKTEIIAQDMIMLDKKEKMDSMDEFIPREEHSEETPAAPAAPAMTTETVETPAPTATPEPAVAEPASEQPTSTQPAPEPTAPAESNLSIDVDTDLKL